MGATMGAMSTLPDGPERPDDVAAEGPGGPDDGAGAADDVREKFRQALARKQGRGGDGSAAGRTGPATHPHTAPAKPQRSFRRKSG
jgi:hypothetical protein